MQSSLFADDAISWEHIGRIVFNTTIATVSGLAVYEVYYILKNKLPYILSKKIRNQVALEEAEREAQFVAFHVNAELWRYRLLKAETPEEIILCYQLYGPPLPEVTPEEQEEVAQDCGLLRVDSREINNTKISLLKERSYYLKQDLSDQNNYTTDQSSALQTA